MNRIVEPGNFLASGTPVHETLIRWSMQPAMLAAGSGTRLCAVIANAVRNNQLIGAMNDESLVEVALRRFDDAFVLAAHPMPSNEARVTIAALTICCEKLRPQTDERLEQDGRPVRIVPEAELRNSAPAPTVVPLAARRRAPSNLGDDPIFVALPADHSIAAHAVIREALAWSARGAISPSTGRESRHVRYHLASPASPPQQAPANQTISSRYVRIRTMQIPQGRHACHASLRPVRTCGVT